MDLYSCVIRSIVVLGGLLVLAGCGGSAGSSPNADLIGLVPSAGTLAPTFAPDVTTYTVGPAGLLTSGSVRLTPTAQDASATITVGGIAVASGSASLPITMPVGTGVIPVVVTAGDGTEKTYHVTLTRLGPTIHEAYLKASNTDAADQFGQSVAVSGDTLVVTALLEDSGATGVDGNQVDDSVSNAGAAYVFVRTGTTWTQQAYLKASNTGTADDFGYCAAIDGDTIVVGAPYEDSAAAGVNGNQGDNSLSGAGAAYVFVRSGTTWSQQAYLKASNPDAGDFFGFSVDVSGDTIVVGAPIEASNATGANGDQNDNGSPVSGATYVYTRSGTTWTQQAYLKASNTQSNDQFGIAVAIDEDVLVVGANGEDSSATGVNGNQADNGAPLAGAVYVFTRSGTTWTQQAYLKASNTDSGDGFGLGVAVSGSTLLVSAMFEGSTATGVNGNDGDNGALNSGAAYVFTRTGTTWSQQAYLKASNTEASDNFGVGVALAGDAVVVAAYAEASHAAGVNGDQGSNSAPFAGAAYAFTRTGTAWAQHAYLKASNTDPNDQYGGALFSTGVAVGDDFVAVGAHFEASSAAGVNGNESDNSASMSGAVYVTR